MKIYILIFLLAGIYTPLFCMEIPKIFRHMNWKKDIRELDANKDFTQEGKKERLDDILEYAVDKYEQRKKITLTEEERESRKLILLVQARKKK